jgi:nucleoside 2-deoxyribosyltransferase
MAMKFGNAIRILTDKQPAGLIDNQMRAAILSARFVIADLTDGNQGAYWEAGFAEGLGLPVFYSCEETVWQEKKTHFDTNHMKTIIWKSADLQKAGDDLAATIRATLRADAKQADD